MSLAEALLPGFVLEMVQGKMTEGEKELAYNLTVIYGLSLLSMIVLYRLLKPVFTPPCEEAPTSSTLPSLASTTALIKARRSVMPKDLSGDRLSKEEVEAVLEAAVWAPTHHKNQPWRFTVLDGPQAIAGYLDRLDAWYSDHKEEIDQQEFNKFLAKLEGSRTSWVNNASHVVVLGMVRQAGETRAAEWEEVILALICSLQPLSSSGGCCGMCGAELALGSHLNQGCLRFLVVAYLVQKGQGQLRVEGVHGSGGPRGPGARSFRYGQSGPGQGFPEQEG